jgi:hypothetical protein
MKESNLIIIIKLLSSMQQFKPLSNSKSKLVLQQKPITKGNKSHEPFLSIKS